MYKERFDESDLTYTDVAHELGCCELTARKKIIPFILPLFMRWLWLPTVYLSYGRESMMEA